MDIKKDYEQNVQNLISLLKVIHPELTPLDISVIKTEIRAIVVGVIIEIGNNIHSLPKQIRNDA
jgi:hypothetical protein